MQEGRITPPTPPSGDWTVGTARLAEVPRLADVERGAATLFAGVGMPEIVEAEPTPAEILAAAAAQSRLLVLRGGDGEVWGFALCDRKDGQAYLAELSVHPVAQGRRLGASLIEAAAAWGRAGGMAWLALSTFRDVPWNGPYYRRLGFKPLPAASLGPELQAVRAKEIANGLDGARREFLRRPTGT